MEEALQHKTTPQCSGLPPAGPGNHRSDGPKADHALTIKLDHLGGADQGEFATIAELAEREGIAPSYMTRVLRLTLLAPDIVEAILDGKQGPEVTLARLLEPFATCWEDQAATISDLWSASPNRADVNSVGSSKVT
jgi:hypothetical protein